MVYLSTVKTILTSWQESIRKNRSLKKHFMTKATIDDVMCTIEGMMLYLVKLSVEQGRQMSYLGISPAIAANSFFLS